MNGTDVESLCCQEVEGVKYFELLDMRYGDIIISTKSLQRV